MSNRYTASVCVLFALALIPTFIHSYTGDVEVDGRSTSLIPFVAAGFNSTPTNRDSAWAKRRFDSDDWLDRTYLRGDDEVRLTVVRSYDLKRLYHHPELAVAYGTSFVGHQVRYLPQNSDIPVHLLQPGPGVSARAMYVLHYDGRFVQDPIWFQIRTAGELLFSRRKPMTLFFVNDISAPDDADPATLPSTTLLFAAIDQFVSGRNAGVR
jgi:hypothetical protein